VTTPTASSIDRRAALRGWVLDRNRELDPATLRDDTPLISTRLVTSLQVIDLLLFIESLRERPVNPGSLCAGAFRDIDTIHRTFLAEAA
jgi:hypothetical protein